MIGIGSGTALGSAMIDVSCDIGDKQKEAVIDSLKAEKKKITDEISEINSKLSEKETPDNQGFLNDILTDRKGVTGFYRIQMVAWTIILGVIYIFSVWSTLAMPTFSDTLLALQGLSAGTYLGFKFPDRKL